MSASICPACDCRAPGEPATFCRATMERIALHYEAVSMSTSIASPSTPGRAMEWKRPLWDAVHAYQAARGVAEQQKAVVAIENAVERAMRLAVYCVLRDAGTLP